MNKNGTFGYKDGTKEWWYRGELHREDGPAVVHDTGAKEWWLEGKLHRIDGPALEWHDGTKEWWLEGRRYSSQEEYTEALSSYKKRLLSELLSSSP